MFSGTVWQNIAYAKPDATPEEIVHAAKIANTYDFIVKFPDGYDTRVGERGHAYLAVNVSELPLLEQFFIIQES